MHLSALSFQEVQYQRTFIVFKCLSFYEFQLVAKLWPKPGATIMFVCCDKNHVRNWKVDLNWDLKEIDVTYPHIP